MDDSKMDDFFKNLRTNDARKKLALGQEIIDYLGDPENSVECEDTGAFMDDLIPWVQSSNFKISQNGLDVVGLLVERHGPHFRPYLNTVVGPTVDRLGDTKESVREKASIVLNSIVSSGVLEPQALMEKIQGAFSHKSGKVKEEILYFFQNMLNSYGAQSFVVSKFLPSVVSLLSDPTGPVREAAIHTLVEIYRHVGERLRNDLQKKYSVPAQKLSVLLQRFDEVRDSGDMIATADSGRGEDEPDRLAQVSASSAKSSVKSRSSSLSRPTGKNGSGVFAVPRAPGSSVSSAGGDYEDTPSSNRMSARSRASAPTSGGGSTLRRNASMRSSVPNAAGGAGAVDEESFIQAFETVKRVNIFSGRGLQDELTKIKETLAKSSNDWKQRIEALCMFRSLIVAGALNYDEFANSLRAMDQAFMVSVKDLRSQVVREACITIAYLSQRLGTALKVDRFLESLFQSLINLIPNSAKVMSTSGIVCIRFIIQNTFSPRFLPILTSNISSRSKEIRRHVSEFLDHLLHAWPTHTLEKHVSALQEAVKKGIVDADPDARQFARKAYWGFADHFKAEADVLLNSLEGNHRRLLQAGEMSNSSSSNSLHTAGSAFPRGATPVGGGSSSYGQQREQQQHQPQPREQHYSSSSHTTNNGFAARSRSRQGSVASSRENLADEGQQGQSREPMRRTSSTLSRKSSGIPVFNSPMKTSINSPYGGGGGYSNGSPYGYNGGAGPPPTGGGSTTPGTPNSMGFRSNSAIDASAVRRANVRAQYAQKSRIQAVTGTLTRSRRPSTDGKNYSITDSPQGMPPTGRPGSRTSGAFAHSQPGSRSASPTSLRSYQTYYDSPGVVGGNTVGRRRSGIPRSTTSSREPSPHRFGGGAQTPTMNARGGVDRRGSTPKRPLMTEHILRQSREAETALEDALRQPQQPRRGSSIQHHQQQQEPPFGDVDVGSDNESETSSLSSVGQNGGHANGNNGRPSPMKPRHLQSPTQQLRRSNLGMSPASRYSRGKSSDPVDDSENMNPEDVHKSLRSTASAIQNYAFDSSTGASGGAGPSPGSSRTKFFQPPTSLSSLEDKMSLMDLGSAGDGSPVSASSGSKSGDNNGHVVKRNGNHIDEESARAIQEIMSILQAVKTNPGKSGQLDRRTSMTQLIRMIREEKTEVIQENFRAILRLLIENLSDEAGVNRALVYGVLTEMLKRAELVASFQAFTELIILRVLEAQRDPEKDVERAAEVCAGAMAAVLPPDTVLRVLNPIVKTGDFPVNQAAIKMLTKVADHENSKDIVIANLGDIMPGLLKAYDHVESSVRKASVFCMVALHQLVGDGLQPHLEVLNGSKLKLLNLYIKRAQAQKEQSLPVSPRSVATPL